MAVTGLLPVEVLLGALLAASAGSVGGGAPHVLSPCLALDGIEVDCVSLLRVDP